MRSHAAADVRQGRDRHEHRLCGGNALDPQPAPRQMMRGLRERQVLDADQLPRPFRRQRALNRLAFGSLAKRYARAPERAIPQPPDVAVAYGLVDDLRRQLPCNVLSGWRASTTKIARFSPTTGAFLPSTRHSAIPVSAEKERECEPTSAIVTTISDE